MMYHALLTMQVQSAKLWILIVLILKTVLGSTQPASAPLSPKTTEVCVYGATPAGIAAAVAAARSGRQVLLIEPTAQVGGLLSSGLSYSDFLSFESLSGFFLEFSQRVKEYYVRTYGANAKQVQQCWRGTMGEPHVNQLILKTLLNEQSGIEVVRETVLVAVKSQGSKVLEAQFRTDEASFRVRASIFVDGSYEGDLMAASGVPYRVGREGQDEYHESLAPPVGDGQLQGYNFRFCATQNPDNRAVVHAPPGYHREDFLDLLPLLASGEIDQVFGYPNRCIYKAHLPALPNRKHDINDVSNGTVRLSMPGRNLRWPDGDAAERQSIYDEHLRYNVGLLYFIQNDPAVPAAFQREALRWGWCKDEFEATNHLPPQLYVREARRMQGRHVYTQHDSEYDAAQQDARARFHPEAIAMSDYGNNCHGTSHQGPLIGGEHHGEFYNPVPPYQIPYGVLLSNEFDNLLVPVAASASHVGFSALRFEPTWTSLGQAAGHAAALAIERKTSLFQLDVQVLQQRLHAAGMATIYVSDVLAGHTDFAAVQWWGALGGLHGLRPRSDSPRGRFVVGQYFEAAPGHQVELALPLVGGVKKRWIDLARQQGITTAALEHASTRGEFIRTAFAER